MARDPSLTETLDYLEDQNVRETTHIWWRRGNRGHLHGSKHCWRATHALAVTYTLEQAAARARCPSCFISSLTIREHVHLAAGLRVIDIELQEARNALSKGTHESINQALDSAHDLLERLEDIEHSRYIEHVYSAYRRVETDTRALKLRARERVGEHKNVVLATVAVDLHAVAEGKNGSAGKRYSNGVPHASDEAMTRAGTGTSGDPLALAYKAWQQERIAGTDAVKAAIKTCTAEATLDTLDQINGVTLTTSAEGDATKRIKQAWSQRIQHDIEELVRIWEAEADRNLAEQALVTVGVARKRNVSYWADANTIFSVLRAYDHAETTQTLVGTYPQVVAWWLLGHLAKQGETAATPLTAGELHTVSVLWDPERQGAYKKLADAACAARAL